MQQSRYNLGRRTLKVVLLLALVMLQSSALLAYPVVDEQPVTLAPLAQNSQGSFAPLRNSNYVSDAIVYQGRLLEDVNIPLEVGHTYSLYVFFNQEGNKYSHIALTAKEGATTLLNQTLFANSYKLGRFTASTGDPLQITSQLRWSSGNAYAGSITLVDEDEDLETGRMAISGHGLVSSPDPIQTNYLYRVVGWGSCGAINQALTALAGWDEPINTHYFTGCSGNYTSGGDCGKGFLNRDQSMVQTTVTCPLIPGNDCGAAVSSVGPIAYLWEPNWVSHSLGLADNDNGLKHNPTLDIVASQHAGWNPVSGNYTHQGGEGLVPTTNGMIPVNWVYNSLSDAEGVLGRGWTHNYAMHLEFEGTEDVWLFAPDGAELFFESQGNGSFSSELWIEAQLQKLADGRYTLTLADQSMYYFDANGNLETITDSQGYTTTLSYSGESLTSVYTFGGPELTLSYNVDGRLSQVSDALTSTIYFTYTGNQLSTVSDTFGNTYTYTYNSDGLLAGISMPSGVVYENTYDPHDRLLSRTSSSGGAYSYAYAEYEASVTDAADNTTTYVHDEIGMLSAVTDNTGNTTTYTRDANYNIVP